MPNLTAGTGAEVAESTQVKRPSSARMQQVRFGEGERIFFRLATRETEFLTADIHRFMPVLTQPPAEMVAKAKEAGKEVNWPKGMWAVCQDDRIFWNVGPDGEPIRGSYEAGYGTCRLKDIFAGQKDRFQKDMTKTDRQTFAVVVLQEATFEGSTLRGLKDKTEKFTDKDGAEVTVPALRYMAQLYRNVYSAILNAVALDGGDPYGRSFMIKREGTNFTVALVPGLKANEDELATYAKTLELMGFTLGDFILNHADPEHYDRFWGDGSGTPPPNAGGLGATSAAPEPDAAPGVPVDENAALNLAGFADQLAKNAAKAGAEPAAVSA